MLIQRIDSKFDELLFLARKKILREFKKEYKKKKDYLLALFALGEFDYSKYRLKMLDSKINNTVDDILEEIFVVFFDWLWKFYPSEITFEELNDETLYDLNWKDRVYNNKVILMNRIFKAFSEAKTPKDFEKLVAKIYVSSAGSLDALIITELNRIENETALNYCKKKHLKWKWVAYKDERTCNDCMVRDGRVFTTKDKFPPLHPRCRCHAQPLE